MLIYLTSFLAGFVLAIPPGPVSLETIRYSIRKGIRAAIFFIIGVASVDGLFFGSAGLLISLTSIISFDEPTRTILNRSAQVFSILLLLVIGVYYVVRSKRVGSTESVAVGPQTIVDSTGLANQSTEVRKMSGFSLAGSAFMRGTVLAMANGINPTFLPSLFYTQATLHSFFGVVEVGSKVAVGLCFGLGVLSWLLSLSYLSSQHIKRSSEEILRRIEWWAGLILLVIGTYLITRQIFR